jgi:hypothetical protein
VQHTYIHAVMAYKPDFSTHCWKLWLQEGRPPKTESFPVVPGALPITGGTFSGEALRTGCQEAAAFGICHVARDNQ